MACTATVTIAGVMVPAICTVMAATDTTIMATGMLFRGGWVHLVRLITIPTTMLLEDHGIQAVVAATGHNDAARTGAGPATTAAA